MSFDQTLAGFLAAESRLAPTVPTARPTTRRKAKPSAPGIHLGTVALWDDDRGFGFIRMDSPGSIGGNRDDDIFLHATALKRSGFRSLNKGARIAFDVAESKFKTGAREASNITIIEEQP